VDDPGDKLIVRGPYILFFLNTFAGRGQGLAPAWNSFHFGRLSMKYPPTWKTTKETYKGQARGTLTPDSMQHLTMRIVEMIELPLDASHTYAGFRQNFATILKSQPDWSTRIIKTEEISLKDHKAMYAELIHNSLPAKLYAINAGTKLYIIFVLRTRHVDVPDPKMEKDGMAILNSITFDK